jgi:solute carrier family 6 GABA transporter-like protein 1
LDCLQSYIDSLVELGRLDDSKLGINFWREWKANVDPFGTARKRKRSDNERQPELGALSLHNGMIFEDTVAAMVKSGMGESVAVLDLTGIHTLTDPLIDQLLSIMPNLRRLSLKNCRRLTGKSLVSVARHLPSLTCLDIGGSYNITVADVLEQLPNMPNLQELYASGLGWTDLSLEQLCANRFWKGLGVGFSPGITPSGLRESLKSNSELERLSIPFCEDALDTSLLGFLGRSLKKVKALDIRGNSGVNSLTTWFDGRAATGARETQPLFCLARYSNVTSSSIEDTKRVHPMLALDLKVVLDAKGIGGGIKR